jgi:superfamily II DNA helicase RecQ
LQTDLGGLALKLKDPKNMPKTVVFCRTKNVAARIYYFLSKEAASRECVSMFHASLTDETKASVYRTFSSSNSVIRCLCATVAFGMVR